MKLPLYSRIVTTEKLHCFMCGRTVGQTERRADGQIKLRKYEWVDGLTNCWKNGEQTDWRTGEHTDAWRAYFATDFRSEHRISLKPDIEFDF